ncbi:MAG: DNA repair protein RecO [Rhodospirillaceae bacterium]|nr:DNA repair protein RecO [Rhodospirillaceae bacterium]
MAISWEDHGIVLAARRLGEHDAIVSLLTEGQGRHAGVVKGGSGKTARALLQSGNVVKAGWRGRLDTHIGTYTLEPVHNFAAGALSSPAALAGLTALCAMVETALPEREPHGAVYRHTLGLLQHLGAPGWEAEYVLWEMELLRDMGYGLDLRSCAATGVTEDLVYVSPRSGRAVSRGAGAPYVDKLFALPPFLKSEQAHVGDADIVQGLALTGYFFEAHVFGPHRRKMPASRVRFAERFKI